MDEPLFLQVKEADRSVLAPWWGGLWTASEGRRVVAGPADHAGRQRHLPRVGRGRAPRLLRAPAARHEGRRPNFATMRAGVLADYLQLCGWTLARAHARAGAAAEIAGYLGKGVAFDRAAHPLRGRVRRPDRPGPRGARRGRAPRADPRRVLSQPWCGRRLRLRRRWRPLARRVVVAAEPRRRSGASRGSWSTGM